jgi:hypothetical protein
MKSIYETPSNAIYGQNAYLPLRLDTYISQGEEDIKKHAMIHAKDCHPGLTETEDEVVRMIKTV